MFRLRAFLLATACVIAAASTLCAQADSWTVITIAQDTVANCTLFKLSYPFLLLATPMDTCKIHLDSIKVIIENRSSRFLSGAGYGFLVGGSLTALLGTLAFPGSSGEEYLNGFVGGGLFGSILGGISGLISGIDDEFDFTEATREAKINKIESLIAKK